MGFTFLVYQDLIVSVLTFFIENKLMNHCLKIWDREIIKMTKIISALPIHNHVDKPFNSMVDTPLRVS
jgi:hypothetical protein